MIHSFQGNNVPADGFTPRGGLVNGSDGNLYGTTAGGGPSGAHGTVFKMTTAGEVTTLHTFVGTDGDTPVDVLVHASDGNFYGTTAAGGTHSVGTVFRISSSGTFASLYSFDTSTGGYSPAAGLVQAADGNLYGTTQFGGDNSLGTVFRMSLGGTPEKIYSFASAGAEGYIPRGALVVGPGGNLYGTTHDGGNPCSCGAVFELTPDAPTTSTTTAPTTTTSTTHASVTTTSSTSTTTSASTSTTSLATTTTAPVTTSTTAVAIVPPTTTTTTTLPAGGCEGAPSGPTFPSIRCRLVALRDQVSGEPGLGSLAPKLEHTLDKAITRLDDANSHCTSAAGTKKAKSRVGQVKRALIQYVHRLGALSARKKLDPTLRQTFMAAGAAITPDVTTLRAQLVCPVADAG